MAKGMPSLLALLGLVAVAGYQNRDKLRDMIGDAQRGGSGRSDAGPDRRNPAACWTKSVRCSVPEIPDGTYRRAWALSSAAFVPPGKGRRQNSWVSTEANKELQPDELEKAIGDDTIDELSQKTGLSRDEIVKRLTAALPETVNRLTPDGRLPSETEAQRLI